jgi:hypothetical protein
MSIVYYSPWPDLEVHTKEHCAEFESKYDWPNNNEWVKDWMQEEIAEDYYGSCAGEWNTGETEFIVFDENMNKIMKFSAEIEYEPRFYTKEINE